MGREFASAAARWVHLDDLGVRPELVAVCDTNPQVLAWYERLRPAPRLVSDWHELIADESIEAVYCAVPHHLHEELYTAALRAGKHLLGEKPFGIDLPANEAINREIAARPDLLVRCSSELPFYPGGQEVARFVRERRFGRVIEVRSLFLHSSDLDPEKPINWKRRAALNGAYGCLGDLGMHALHLPLRAGWAPQNVRAILTDVVPERPDGAGGSGALRHVGQRRPPLRGGGRRASVPAPDRDQADRAGRDEHVDDRDRRHRSLDRVHDQVPEDAPDTRVRAGPAAGLADDRSRVRLCLPDDHGRDLRVRLLGRDPPDVGSVPRRARTRARAHAPALLLRDAGRGRGHAPPVHGSARVTARLRRSSRLSSAA